MDLHDSHLRSFVIHVFVEGDETWLVGFDEVDQSRDAQSLGLKLSRLQSVRRDEDERPGHGVPPSTVRREVTANSSELDPQRWADIVASANGARRTLA